MTTETIETEKIRYWVSFGNWDPEYRDLDSIFDKDEKPEDAEECLQRTQDRLEEIANQFRPDFGSAYVTYSLADAEEAIKKAEAIIKEIWVYAYDVVYDGWMKVVPQQRCGKCGSWADLV